MSAPKPPPPLTANADQHEEPDRSSATASTHHEQQELGLMAVQLELVRELIASGVLDRDRIAARLELSSEGMTKHGMVGAGRLVKVLRDLL